MKKWAILNFFILNCAITFAQRGGFLELAEEDFEPVTWSESIDNLVPGLVIFIVGLAVARIFKSFSFLKNTGYVIMAFGGFLALGGFFLMALRGLGMLLSSGLVLVAVYYFYTEIIKPNL